MRSLEPYVGPSQPDIPLSESGRGNGLLRMRMSSLQIGDSFETDYSRHAAYRMSKVVGIKVECRKIVGKIRTIRVWRTE